MKGVCAWALFFKSAIVLLTLEGKHDTTGLLWGSNKYVPA